MAATAIINGIKHVYNRNSMPDLDVVPPELVVESHTEPTKPFLSETPIDVPDNRAELLPSGDKAARIAEEPRGSLRIKKDAGNGVDYAEDQTAPKK